MLIKKIEIKTIYKVHSKPIIITFITTFRMVSCILCFVSPINKSTNKQTIFVVLCTENKQITLLSGTREKGENDEQAMYREMEEECKIPRAKLKRWITRNGNCNAQFIKCPGSYGGTRKIYMAFVPWDKQHSKINKYKHLVEDAYGDYSLPPHEREIETIGIFDLSMLQLIPNRSDYLKDVTSVLQIEIPKCASRLLPNIVNVPIPTYVHTPVPVHTPMPVHSPIPVYAMPQFMFVYHPIIMPYRDAMSELPDSKQQSGYMIIGYVMRPYRIGPSTTA